MDKVRWTEKELNAHGSSSSGSLAKVITQLVNRGEEDLAEELLSLGASQLTEAKAAQLAVGAYKSVEEAIDYVQEIQKWLMNLSHENGGEYQQSDIKGVLDEMDNYHKALMRAQSLPNRLAHGKRRLGR